MHLRHQQRERRSKPLELGLGFVKAAISKAHPRQQQGRILECPQCGRALPLAACGVATLCAGNPNARPPPLRPLSLITSLNGNTVRNFPTHGQLSAAQGSPTTVSA